MTGLPSPPRQKAPTAPWFSVALCLPAIDRVFDFVDHLVELLENFDVIAGLDFEMMVQIPCRFSQRRGAAPPGRTTRRAT